MSDGGVKDFLLDHNGEQSKTKRVVIIGLVAAIVIVVLLTILNKNAQAATSSGGTGSSGGGGTTTTTASGPDYAGQLSYAKGLSDIQIAQDKSLADIQNAQATLSESLQEKLLNNQTASSKDVATFNSNLQQTNTMNYINDLIYGQKSQFAESQSEAQQQITSAPTLLATWYNNLTGTKVANGQTLLDVLGGWGGDRQNAASNAAMSSIFKGWNFSGKGTATQDQSAPSDPFADFFKNFNPTSIQAHSGA